MLGNDSFASCHMVTPVTITDSGLLHFLEQKNQIWELHEQKQGPDHTEGLPRGDISTPRLPEPRSRQIRVHAEPPSHPSQSCVGAPDWQSHATWPRPCCKGGWESKVLASPGEPQTEDGDFPK